MSSIREEDCRVKFYHIDENFMPLGNFADNDFILYVNYFGINSSNCKKLAQKYPNLIIDNTQGFYCEQIGLASFNSLRKFFNVENGAYLHIDKVLRDIIIQDDFSCEPVLIHKDYNKFVFNEESLNSEKEIKLISPKVEKVVEDIDFESDKISRVELFKKYDEVFGKYNLISLKLTESDIPYCYPFSTDNIDIIKHLQKFILLRLWKGIPKNFPEYNFLNNVAAFPLNDRDYANKIMDIKLQ